MNIATASTPDVSSDASSSGLVLLGPVPEGMDAMLMRQTLKDLKQSGDTQFVVHVARDDQQLAQVRQAVGFFCPKVPVLEFPAWDCLPYDRVSPSREAVGRRMTTLCKLAGLDVKALSGKKAAGLIVLTTINALLQRVIPPANLMGQGFEITPNSQLDQDALLAFLARQGFQRSGTVREPGEYAVRGGIIDIFPTGASNPVRLDLFGDEVDSIKRFDADSQRSTALVKRLSLFPVAEVPLTDDAVGRFRSGYRQLFGQPKDDPLYESLSNGRAYPGMEHWLPLFFEGNKLVPLMDYLPHATFLMANQSGEARATRLEQIDDFYTARKDFIEAQKATSKKTITSETRYNPIPAELLYVNAEELDNLANNHRIFQQSPYRLPESETIAQVNVDARAQLDFAEARQDPDINLYEAVMRHVREEQREGRRVAISGLTEGSKTRLGSLMFDAGIEVQREVKSFDDVLALDKKALGLATLSYERGVRTNEFSLITEQDILGDRLARPAKKRKAENFLKETSTLDEGDLVVHVDHGIGRYQGLMTLDIGGAAHDVLCLVYHGDDKLYVPVENIEVLSRFGSADGVVALDKLGGANWQARKAAMKKRLKVIAGDLIKIAAARQLRKGDVLEPMTGVWEDFCARFPYSETEDQLNAIEEVVQDLASGRPMDRLVCGDVGFGKTEVAIRAAFVSAMSGKQVAVTVPTTLLSRQHYANFIERFKGFPLKIGQLSRLVPASEQNRVREGLASGDIDIVIGTHGLLAESIKFNDLGLLVIDEEQRFGVKQKEQLKQLRETVHVLTLSATPIPRTLQLALTGVKELSLIATPPVDRLAVRTFVMPWDPVIIREALMREHFRGGQSFVVCPRVADLADLYDRLQTIAPELKVVSAHGQLAPADLERVMTDFYDHKFDCLLSTNIVESGLDIPSVNTLIIHRADMFGLSGLYQLRGRVGRSKTRGYAYLTVSPTKRLTPTAQRRLEVMQTLDTLGAGFNLASHDMDIRGAGNLVGEEQSGHIKEVGIELYQQMLEEAVRNANTLGDDVPEEETWSPKIDVGIPVLIPENYVADLPTRLGLYRRLGTLEDTKEIEAFAAELIDRFGPLPREVENLMEVVTIKHYARAANVEKIDTGPKGAIIAFRKNRFPQPEKLMAWIDKNHGVLNVRPEDQRLVYKRNFGEVKERVTSVRRVMKNLAGLAR